MQFSEVTDALQLKQWKRQRTRSRRKLMRKIYKAATILPDLEQLNKACLNVARSAARANVPLTVGSLWEKPLTTTGEFFVAFSSCHQASNALIDLEWLTEASSRLGTPVADHDEFMLRLDKARRLLKAAIKYVDVLEEEEYEALTEAHAMLSFKDPGKWGQHLAYGLRSMHVLRGAAACFAQLQNDSRPDRGADSGGGA